MPALELIATMTRRVSAMPASGSNASLYVSGQQQDDLVDLYGDVLAVWRPWAGDLRGGPIDCGHHMAEEAPDALAERLLTFSC